MTNGVRDNPLLAMVRFLEKDEEELPRVDEVARPKPEFGRAAGRIVEDRRDRKTDVPA